MKLFILITLFCCGIAATRGIVPTKKSEGQRLIKVSDEDPGQWVSQTQLFDLRRQGVHFLDITEIPAPNRADLPIRIHEFPEAVNYKATVESLIANLDIERSRKFLEFFSGFYTRMYNTEMGKVAALWLKAEIQTSISNTQYQGQARVDFFEGSYLQPNVIAKIEGSDPTLKNEIVILGAHLDSVNWDNTALSAPGADDAGSAVAVTLEVFRTLLEANFVPQRTLEFQYYTGEETGLLGSREIAANYSAENINVISMLNLDLVGLYSEPKIGITIDRTDSALSDFIRLLVTEYSEYENEDYTCGYACSDHTSFTEYGFPSAFPVEPWWFRDGNPDTDVHHTVKDTVDRLSFDQIKEYMKIAIGYAVEISLPTESI